MSPLFSIWDAELVISRCTVGLWSAKESEAEMEDSQHRFLPAEILWPQVNTAKLSKLKLSLVGHTTVWCAHWKINLAKVPVTTNLKWQWISKGYQNLLNRYIFLGPVAVSRVFITGMSWSYCIRTLSHEKSFISSKLCMLKGIPLTEL